MSTVAKFCAIFAALSGIVLLCSIAPTSAYRSLSLARDTGKDYLVFSDSILENTTLYYGVCDRATNQPRKECIVRRVRADFTGDSPKEDECRVTLRSGSEADFVVPVLTKIDSLGKDRAIVRWIEDIGGKRMRNIHLRFSVVDFSTCKVVTTKISNDLNHLSYNVYRKFDHRYWDTYFGELKKYGYLKGEDDFEVLTIGANEVYRLSIDSEGVVSKIDTNQSGSLLSYSKYHEPNIFALSKDKGYLLIDALNELTKDVWPPVRSTTIAHIDSNGQRRNLTHFNDTAYPSVSLANGLIGICLHLDRTLMKCTQFKLDDKEIKWFSVDIVTESEGQTRAIYNLPRGEGFLTYVNIGRVKSDIHICDNYLVKIGLDGKAEKFLDPDMRCQSVGEFEFTKFFEDDRGNYCLSAACVKTSSDFEHYDEYVEWSMNNNTKSSYVKLHSKCFEPNDFKKVSKYDIKRVRGLTRYSVDIE